MRTVKEISELTGVSVRTLHHYDAIGLLKPTQVTGAGYRLYDDTALERLQTILMFRELRFPLRQIRENLESPALDRRPAVKQQLELLLLQKKRLEELISHAREIIETGEDSMDFSTFDRSEYEEYVREAKRKWGDTQAYREFEEKAGGRTPKEEYETAEGLMAVFAELGKIRKLAPDSAEAQMLAERLRQYISLHYYDCTPEIFCGLGQMYAADGHIKENIDRAGGEGTAEFAAQVIRHYAEGPREGT